MNRARGQWTGDVWGGVSAMLVALPSAIAFGVAIYAPLGSSFGARGAGAGILGAVALGLVASVFGGTKRLISAPCAPAAAVLSALAIQWSQQNTPAATAAMMLAVVALLTAGFQMLFGTVGLGKLIKYMPYPVVSGYLSGVGLLIILSQVPKVLGAPDGTHLWEAVSHPALWQHHALAVGVATIAGAVFGPRLTKRVPGTILGIVAGMATYGLFALGEPALRTLAGNPAIVGPFEGGGPAGAVRAIGDQLRAFRALDLTILPALIAPALSLAVLLSIDTLKTCVVLDAMTRSRHDSNRELVGQGLGNLAATVIGGMPGAGTMGATLVNLNSGAQTRFSGIVDGLASLVVFLALGTVIGWIPIAALAGILIVVGIRMFDWHSLSLLRSRATVLDFSVIVAVVVVAETVNLIAASATGVALAILLFIREQVRGSVVRRIGLGNAQFSKQVRPAQQMAVLERLGDRTAVVELQGSLFFGTTDQLGRTLEPHLAARQFVILDFWRVQSVDVTAAHLLEQVAATLHDKNGDLLLSGMPRRLAPPGGLPPALAQLGPGGSQPVKLFGELSEALEYAEDALLAEAHAEHVSGPPLELHEIELFSERKPETLRDFESVLERRHLAAGEAVFSTGDTGDELFLIRRGAVRIVLPVGQAQTRHLATFRRGSFFGEMAFLDHQPRSADAIAERETDLYVLSRARFETFAQVHRALAMNLMDGVARALARRLRHTNAEVRELEGEPAASRKSLLRVTEA
jgi:SulP family sulfate permease